jgi:hypothetical protein
MRHTFGAHYDAGNFGMVNRASVATALTIGTNKLQFLCATYN